MQEDWTSSLSFATSFDTIGSRNYVVTDFPSDQEISTPQASSFPTPPPRHIVPQSISQQAPLRGPYRVGLSADLPDSIASRPMYLALERGNAVPSRSLAEERQGDNAWTEDLQSPLQKGKGFGSAESSVSEPLEQLRRSISCSSVSQTWWEGESAALPQRQDTAARPRSHSRANFQRPQIGSGLPTSYKHDSHRVKSSSTSKLSSSIGSIPRTWLHHGAASPQLPTPPLSASSAALEGAKVRRSASPALVQSPPLHFEVVRDQPWSTYISETRGPSSRPSSAGSIYGTSLTSSVHRAYESDIGHSRGPSFANTIQTQATSVGDSCYPSRPPSASGNENPISAEELNRSMRLRGQRHNHERVRFDTTSPRNQHLPGSSTSQPQSILTGPSSQRSHPAFQHDSAHNHAWRTQDSASANRVPSVTTELIYGPRYLEPHNSCEAILLPKPRLRSRSLGSTPAIVVEKVYAAPERFWQRNVDAKEGNQLHVVPRLRVGAHFNGRPDQAQTQVEVQQPVRSPRRDPRLVLHESIPPPVPPKDAALPSSGLLPIKPLPPTPTPPTPIPAASLEGLDSRASEDSIEYLDTPELLQRNRKLEEERQAWREEYRNSLGANAVPLRDRLSPCLKDPSLDAMDRRRLEGPSSDITHNAYPSPIRVHRVWNEDGTEQTFLVVQSKHRHTYSNQRMSASTPDLRLDSIAQRPPFIQGLAERFSSLTGRSRGRSAGDEAAKPGARLLSSLRSPAAQSADSKSPPHTTVDTTRSFGRERRLVTHETVIIGKSPEPWQAAEGKDSQEKLGALRPTKSFVVEAMTGTGVETSHRGPLVAYKPPSTLDELKAQLGDHLHVAYTQEILPQFQVDRDPGEVKSRRAWLDTDADIMGHQAPVSLADIDERAVRIVQERGRAHKGAPLRGTENPPSANLEAGRVVPLSDVPSNVSRGCSDSCDSSQSGRRQSWRTAQPSHDSTASVGRTVRASAELIESTNDSFAGPSTVQYATGRIASDQSVASPHVERSNTDDSTISSDAHIQPTIWDASTVNIDTLFFRPPPSRLPST